MYNCHVYLKNFYSIYNFGKVLSKIVSSKFVIFFDGESGAGKTFLIRGLIKELIGKKKIVKSPTYSIVELYYNSDFIICHIDLYRLINTVKFNDVDLREYLNGKFIFLVEWASKYEYFLPYSHLVIKLDKILKGRHLFLQSNYFCVKSLFF